MRLILSVFIGGVIWCTSLSAQIAPVTDGFLCDINRYTESFESGLPTGWTGLKLDTAKLGGFNEGWVLDQGMTFTPNTGPDAAQDGTFYIYCDGSGPIGRSDTARLVSPVINTGASLEPALQFYLNMHGQSGSLTVNIIDGSNKYQALGPISAMVPGGLHASSVWEEIFIDLSNYQAKDIQIEFVTMKPAGASVGDIAIDNIRICNSTATVPTLSEWAVIILMQLLLIIAIQTIKSPTPKLSLVPVKK